MRRYERRVEIWKRITKRMIPPAEQALRLLEKLEDEAADALAETPIERYDDKDGMQRILTDLRTEGFKQQPPLRAAPLARKYRFHQRAAGVSIFKVVHESKRMHKELEASAHYQEIPLLIICFLEDVFPTDIVSSHMLNFPMLFIWQVLATCSVNLLSRQYIGLMYS